MLPEPSEEMNGRVIEAVKEFSERIWSARGRQQYISPYRILSVFFVFSFRRRC